MPKLRRLSGKEVISILAKFGFTVYSQTGSHIKLQRITEYGVKQRIVVPLHGNKSLKIGTLKSIYRSALDFMDENELYPYFYADS